MIGLGVWEQIRALKDRDVDAQIMYYSETLLIYFAGENIAYLLRLAMFADFSNYLISTGDY